MKIKSCFIFFVSAVLTQTVMYAQTPNNFVVQPLKKTYTKIKNPLIKKNVPVEALIINGNAYLEGDIFLGKTVDLDAMESRVQIQSVNVDESFSNARWENNTVPFEIGGGFTEGQVETILSVIRHISENTNVCFIRKTRQSSYIKFVKYTVDELGFSGGSSDLGRCFICTDGQEVRLSSVSKGLVIHEVGHALGLLHEQSREDRDRHVKIKRENIKAGFENQFDQAVYSSTDVGSYDFGSIMHYSSKAFGKVRNKVTLTTIEMKADPSNISFGQRDGLSQGDINGINRMYTGTRICQPISLLAVGELEIGEVRTKSIYANKEYNYTSAYLREGQKFEFTTESIEWNNGSRETTCNGYPGGLTDILRRHNDLNMMVLTGEIFDKLTSDYSGTYFKIGCSKTYTATKSGFLVVFANDMLGFYGDNSRLVTLHIKRIE